MLGIIVLEALDQKLICFLCVSASCCPYYWTMAISSGILWIYQISLLPEDIFCCSVFMGFHKSINLSLFNVDHFISVKWCQRMRDALLLASDESIWKAEDFLKGDDDDHFFGKARDVKKADSLRHFSSQGKRETVWVFADYSNFLVPASSSQLCSPMCLCCCCWCFYIAVDIVYCCSVVVVVVIVDKSKPGVHKAVRSALQSMAELIRPLGTAISSQEDTYIVTKRIAESWWR